MEDRAKKDLPHSGALSRGSLRLLVITVVSLYAAETILMLLLSILPPVSSYLEALFNSFFISVFVFPSLYLFLYRPIIKNMDDLNKTEELLQKRLRIFSDAVEGAFDAIVISDLSGNIIYANRAALKDFGYTLEEISRMGVYGFTPWRESAEKVMKETIEKGAWSGEIRAIRKNNVIFPVLLSLSAVNDENEKPFALMGIFRDTTEGDRAREALLASEVKYRSLTEGLSEVIYSANPNTMSPTYVNKAVENVYGYTVDEWLKTPNIWEQTIHPDDREIVISACVEADRQKKT